MARSVEHLIKDIMFGMRQTTKTFESLNTSIIKTMVGEQRSDVETDQNDQISVGSYITKHFEVSPQAQKLYVSLPRDVNINEMEKAAILMDELFYMVEKIDSKEFAEQADVDDANRLIARIKLHAKNANMLDKVDFLEGVLSRVTKHLNTEGNIIDGEKFDINKAMKRFMTPSYSKTTEHDKDIDNSKYALSRNLKAQRKLKIIDND